MPAPLRHTIRTSFSFMCSGAIRDNFLLYLVQMKLHYKKTAPSKGAIWDKFIEQPKHQAP